VQRGDAVITRFILSRLFEAQPVEKRDSMERRGRTWRPCHHIDGAPFCSARRWA